MKRFIDRLARRGPIKAQKGHFVLRVTQTRRVSSQTATTAPQLTAAVASNYKSQFSRQGPPHPFLHLSSSLKVGGSLQLSFVLFRTLGPRVALAVVTTVWLGVTSRGHLAFTASAELVGLLS